MARPVYIHIPEPCSQKWEEMASDAQGRFCEHCQHTVTDFTSWSDAALYNFFSKNTQRVCGRFLASQVDRPIHIPYQPHSRLYRMVAAMGLTLLFTQAPAFAQSRPPQTVQTSKSKTTDTTGQRLGEINGTVLDAKNEPVINASVEAYEGGVLKGGAITDYDGKYSIKPLEPGRYDVTAKYTGLKDVSTNSILVAQDKTTGVNFRMESSSSTQLKEVIHLGGPMPLIDRYGSGSAADQKVKSSDIEKMPVRKITER